MYNLENLTNSTDIYQLTYSVNELSFINGYPLFSLSILFITFFITFVVLKQTTTDIDTTLLATSLITTFIAVMLYGLNLMSFKLVYFPFGIFIASLLYIIFKSN